MCGTAMTLIEQHPFALERCIEGALDLVSAKAQEKELELAYLIEEHTPHQVLSDEASLRRILTNLLDNAVKFTQTGEVTLTVTAHPLSSPAGAVELMFVVHDTGIGIAPEQQVRLCQLFSQVDASTTRKDGGTGLGLANSNRLCEAMGGRMWVESVGIAGKGTNIYCIIPVTEVLPAVPASLDAGHILRNKHLIMVLGRCCTAATQWRSLALQAQRWGMEVRFCSSMEELAAWCAAGNRVDVVLIDQRWVDAAHEIAGADAPALAGVRWLLVAPMGDHKPVLGMDIAGYISKPVKSAQWKKELVHALRGARRTAKDRSMSCAG